MRLTLRTLLSYLDNVLDPAARAELEKQIESNENASEWLHRTRDVMRRLKLGTPEVDGTNSVDDPNTVAEYLDRTLPEESVAEFERVCLESDAMLAEVASCHHVLAKVLAARPEIDPDTQKRLHRLQSDLAEAMRSRVEQAHTPPPQVKEPEPTPQTPEPPGRPTRVSTPSYLRDNGPSPLAKWAPAIAALLLLAVTSVLAFRPGGWLNPAQEVAIVDPPGEKAVEEPAAEIETEEPITEPEPEPAAKNSDSVATESSEPPAEPTEATPDPPVSEAEPAEPTTTETPAEPTEVEELPAEPVETEVPPTADPTEPEATPEEQPAPPTPIAFLSQADTLVVSELEPGSWRRVVPGAEFTEPVRLVSLPTYRSRYDLGGGMSLELVGLTQATLTPAGGEADIPSIGLEYGRLVLRRGPAPPPVEPSDGETKPVPDPNEGPDPNEDQVEVVISGVPYTATLGPSAVLAIAADRPFEAGYPVLERSTPLLAMAHGLAGKIEWESADVGLTTSKPRPWIIAGDATGQVPTKLSDPAWVEQLKVSPADGYASPELARAVEPGAPIWPQLMQIAEQENFGEIRSLAGRCSLPLGHPDQLVASFRDPDEEAYWAENLAELRHAASRDKQLAAEILRVFSEAFGERTAEELIDLLIGFEPEEVGLDPETVAEGVIPEFVLPALQSEDLATRVLASLVLKETIEPLDRPYKPLGTTRTRLKSTRWIESRLEKQELTPLAR